MAKAGVVVLCAVTVLISCVVPILATDYAVGDSSGWDTSTDCTAWTDGKTFVVGDHLIFNYDAGMHSVEEVSRSGYHSCSSEGLISYDSSGATRIALTKPGRHYFISGRHDDCTNGMKLVVNVQEGSTSSAALATSTSSSSSILHSSI